MPFSILSEPDRPKTAPLTHEETIHRIISRKTKSTTPSHLPTSVQTSCLIGSSENFFNVTDSLLLQFNSAMQENDTHSVHQSNVNPNIGIHETINPNNYNDFLDLSVNVNSRDKTLADHQDEPKTPYRSSQCKVNNALR